MDKYKYDVDGILVNETYDSTALRICASNYTDDAVFVTIAADDPMVLGKNFLFMGGDAELFGISLFSGTIIPAPDTTVNNVTLYSSETKDGIKYYTYILSEDDEELANYRYDLYVNIVQAAYAQAGKTPVRDYNISVEDNIVKIKESKELVMAMKAGKDSYGYFITITIRE